MCLSQISQSRRHNPCAKIKLGSDFKNGISSQTVPNHCLSSENVDIYFGLWRASFKCLATAKDTELVGKFQPQYAAWWPINLALIFSFLIGIGALFAGLVRCLVEKIGLMITFLSARGTKFLPTKEQYVLLHHGPGWSERFSFKKGEFQLGNAILSGEMNQLDCAVDKWEFSHILTKKLIMWNETFYRMLLLPLTTLCRISLDEIPVALWRITQRWDVAHGCHDPLW